MILIKDKRALEWYQKVRADFPPQVNTVTAKEFFIKMRDGVELNTHIFYPNNDLKEYNVVITRNPYPLNLELYEALYVPLAEQGYCVVIQDCRGTGKSQGKWQPFENERDDGIDTLNWFNEQTWVSQIATFGRSYSGFTQWIVGDMLPSKVKTMILEVYGINRFDQVYSNGIFREDIYTSWAFANSGVKSDILPADQYKQAIKYSPAEERDLKILNQRLPFYQSYLHENNATSDYWMQSIWKTLYDVPSRINVPVLITDGWADHHLEGSLLGYEHLNSKIKKQSRLIVNPADHIGDLTGDINYPNANKFGFLNMKANLDWFDHVFKETKIFNSSIYMMREGSWIDPEVPNDTKMRLYLQNQGGLSEKEPEKSGQIRFTYNPLETVSWPGGNELLAWIVPGFTDKPHGFVKSRKYPPRKDVIVFESVSFDGQTQIVGNLNLHLMVSTNKEDTAFSARVCEYTKDHNYINIKDGIASISYHKGGVDQEYSPNQKVNLNISLGNIAWHMEEGSQLVVLVSSSNFPMYAIHSNYKGNWSEIKIEKNLAEQTIYIGKESYLEVPIKYS